MYNQIKKLLSFDKQYYLTRSHRKLPQFDFQRYNGVVLFGAAKMAKIYLDLFLKNQIKVIAISDNDKNKIGQKIVGVPVISITQLRKYDQDIPIVITSISVDEIGRQLKELGFRKVWPFSYFSTYYSDKFTNLCWQNSIDKILANRKNILKSFTLYQDRLSKQTYLNILNYRLTLETRFLVPIEKKIENIFFDKEIIKLNERETFIDGGAYIGDTIESFLRAAENRFQKIYAFEPDTTSFAVLKQYVQSLKQKNIHIYQLGLSRCKAILKFTNDGTSGSKIDDTGGQLIKVIDLDKFLKNEPVTMIKLDIEGAEVDALNGMSKLIKNNKPKMAVCVYHRPEDLWKVPLLLHKLVPEYRFYLRHYSPNLYETVCYALR